MSLEDNGDNLIHFPHLTGEYEGLGALVIHPKATTREQELEQYLKFLNKR